MGAHRHQTAYPALWRAAAGAVADAMNAHSDIQIPPKRVASIVKRIVGQMLALQGVGAGKPAETAGGTDTIPPASGADCGGIVGADSLVPPPIAPMRAAGVKARRHA